jgi:hypothetical protein
VAAVGVVMMMMMMLMMLVCVWGHPRYWCSPSELRPEGETAWNDSAEQVSQPAGQLTSSPGPGHNTSSSASPASRVTYQGSRRHLPSSCGWWIRWQPVR